MHFERIFLRNFRCFGPLGTETLLATSLASFVGVNGSGKTAVMWAFGGLFGVTCEQRRLHRRDFHVPSDEKVGLTERQLELEAILAFPELDGGTATTAAPAFFQRMAPDENGHLKFRLLLRATWTDDGVTQGNIDESYCAVRTFGDFKPEDCVQLKTMDRARVQFICVPARSLTSINGWPMQGCRRSRYQHRGRALRPESRHD